MRLTAPGSLLPASQVFRSCFNPMPVAQRPTSRVDTVECPRERRRRVSGSETPGEHLRMRMVLQVLAERPREKRWERDDPSGGDGVRARAN